jgi:hypothetical protein
MKPSGSVLTERYALRPSGTVDVEPPVTYTYMLCKKFRDKQWFVFLPKGLPPKTATELGIVVEIRAESAYNAAILAHPDLP